MGNKKKQVKAMREVVAQKVVENGKDVLPPFGNWSIERHRMTGKELKEFSGWTPGTNQFNGATLEDAEKYIYQMPVQVGVNHSRRIKRIYFDTKKVYGHDAGMEAVNQYFATVYQKLTNKPVPQEKIEIDHDAKAEEKFDDAMHKQAIAKPKGKFQGFISKLKKLSHG